MSENLDYNEKYRLRTKRFAVAIILFYSKHCKQTEELRVIGKQLLRSGTSVAANFRAVTRGRSHAERFSKMCIIVEEIDETQFLA
ncbi:MAG TPA: four helix bundle protein [Paludibacter sp.]|nr:four helix bundle protein [Paludibacter sp.]